MYIDSYIIEVDKILLKDDCENELHPAIIGM